MFIAETLNNSSPPSTIHLTEHSVNLYFCLLRHMKFIIHDFRAGRSKFQPRCRVRENLNKSLVAESDTALRSNQIQNWLPLFPPSTATRFYPVMIAKRMSERWQGGRKKVLKKIPTVSRHDSELLQTLRGVRWKLDRRRKMSLRKLYQFRWQPNCRDTSVSVASGVDTAPTEKAPKTKISGLPLCGMKISLALVWRTRHGSCLSELSCRAEPIIFQSGSALFPQPPTSTSSLLFHQTIKSLHWSHYSRSVSLSAPQFVVCSQQFFSNLASENYVSGWHRNCQQHTAKKRKKFTQLRFIRTHSSTTLRQIARQMRPIKYQLCWWKSENLTKTFSLTDDPPKKPEPLFAEQTKLLINMTKIPGIPFLRCSLRGSFH